MKDYWELCKPRVVMLMLLTALVGMFLASPGWVAWQTLVFGNLGIGLAACAGAVLNHIVDRHIDLVMKRTANRPIAAGRVSTPKALLFALLLTVAGMAILVYKINVLTAVLTFCTLVGYGVIYTVFLKHATPQNIVIGGLAGAMPPLLGWTAVTNSIDPSAWLLVLIIFAWTPPHFWALAIYRRDEYAKANVPMLPVTHGIAYTKTQIVFYVWLLSVASLLPFVIGMSGAVYFIGALLLDSGYIYWAYRLKRSDDMRFAKKAFDYSLLYLGALFLLLLADHYLT